MLQKSLLTFTLIILAHPCFSMDDNVKRNLLGDSACPIHTFLTTNFNKTEFKVDEQLLNRFIEVFKTLEVAPTILCDLPDYRNYSTYYYTCPQDGEEYRIEYNDRNDAKHTEIVNPQQHPHGGIVNGLPTAISITRDGQTHKIDLIDLEHTWLPQLYSDKRTYNLLRLLLDCNRIPEVVRILNSTTRPLLQLGEKQAILKSFQAAFKRLNNGTISQTEKEKLTALLQRLTAEPNSIDTNCCYCCSDNCCMTTTQLILLLAMLVPGSTYLPPHHTAKVLKFLFFCGTALLESIKQGDWKNTRHSQVGKLKKD